jgi:hypothetical protein
VRYEPPGAIARALNVLFGAFIRAGLAPRYNVLLQVRGRKSGRLFSVPVNLIAYGGRRYLVAPRGHTQWSRNAAAAGQVTLVRAFRGETVRLGAVDDVEKPPILKAYLDAYPSAVQRYFPVPAGAAVERFAPLAPDYPVFAID